MSLASIRSRPVEGSCHPSLVPGSYYYSRFRPGEGSYHPRLVPGSNYYM